MPTAVSPGTVTAPPVEVSATLPPLVIVRPAVVRLMSFAVVAATSPVVAVMLVPLNDRALLPVKPATVTEWPALTASTWIAPSEFSRTSCDAEIVRPPPVVVIAALPLSVASPALAATSPIVSVPEAASVAKVPAVTGPLSVMSPLVVTSTLPLVAVTVVPSTIQRCCR